MAKHVIDFLSLDVGLSWGSGGIGARSDGLGVIGARVVPVKDHHGLPRALNVQEIGDITCGHDGLPQVTGL